MALLFGAPCGFSHPRSPEWRFWSQADGLAESCIRSVGSGPDGRIWVRHGAVDSMAVLDGYESRPPAGNADRQHRRLGAKGASLWRPERRGLGRGGGRTPPLRVGPLDRGGGEDGGSGNAGGSSRRFPRGAGAVRGPSGSLPARGTRLEGHETAGRDPSGRFFANCPRFFGGFLDHRNNWDCQTGTAGGRRRRPVDRAGHAGDRNAGDRLSESVGPAGGVFLGPGVRRLALGGGALECSRTEDRPHLPSRTMSVDGEGRTARSGFSTGPHYSGSSMGNASRSPGAMRSRARFTTS